MKNFLRLLASFALAAALPVAAQNLFAYDGPDRMDKIAAAAKKEGELTLYTTIAEKEMHAIVLSCTRARRRLLATMSLIGVSSEYRLFSQMKMTPSFRAAAKFIASATAPWFMAPSPKTATATPSHGVPSGLPADSLPRGMMPVVAGLR